MAAVAFRLRLAHRAWLHERQAAAFPRAETARHRDRIRVAHLLQSRAGHERAHATRAVEHHRLRFIGDRFFYLQFEIAARHMDGSGNMSLVPLKLLAYIYKHNFLLVLPGLVLVGECFVHLRRRPF